MRKRWRFGFHYRFMQAAGIFATGSATGNAIGMRADGFMTS